MIRMRYYIIISLCTLMEFNAYTQNIVDYIPLLVTGKKIEPFSYSYYKLSINDTWDFLYRDSVHFDYDSTLKSITSNTFKLTISYINKRKMYYDVILSDGKKIKYLAQFLTDSTIEIKRYKNLSIDIAPEFDEFINILLDKERRLKKILYNGKAYNHGLIDLSKNVRIVFEYYYDCKNNLISRFVYLGDDPTPEMYFIDNILSKKLCRYNSQSFIYNTNGNLTYEYGQDFSWVFDGRCQICPVHFNPYKKEYTP